MERQIVIDGGLITTAKVKNQTLLDLLLDLTLIEIREHIAGEYVMGQCVKAGIHVRGVACDGMPLGGSSNHDHFNGMMPLRSTLKMVKENQYRTIRMIQSMAKKLHGMKMELKNQKEIT